LSSLLDIVGLSALGVAPLVLSRHRGIPAVWPLSGAATWAVGLAVKFEARKLTERPISRYAPSDWVAAACDGLMSALAELVPAGILLALHPPQTAREATAFGAGAGSAEVLYVLALSFISKPDPQSVALWRQGRDASLLVRHFVLAERSTALLSHIGTRGMLWLACHKPGTWTAPRALVPFGLFALADGVASFGTRRKWPWLEVTVARRTHAFYATIAGVALLNYARGALADRRLELALLHHTDLGGHVDRHASQ
jgi:hypothetical protein